MYMNNKNLENKKQLVISDGQIPHYKLTKQERDVLGALLQEPFINQRILAEKCRYSLGTINRALKVLGTLGYVNEKIQLTDKAIHESKQKAPRRAIILAAGFGMRMVPINLITPKALLQVNGERLIERQIRQLHEVGIQEIYVVVGFMKEQFEYLIDEYGVELIVNSEYAVKNNLYSLHLAAVHLENSYIVPCDIWCNKNPFRHHELYSWYMVGDLMDEDSAVRINRKMELVKVSEQQAGNTMIGISYIAEEDASALRNRIEMLCQNEKYQDSFWEEALYQKDRMTVTARVVHSADMVEVNTYEQLRELDSDSEHLKSDALDIIAEVLNVDTDEIVDISVLKKGMTNRSFRFSCNGDKYIMRIPGEGTDQLINRQQETKVYEVLAGKGICDEPVYINPQNGYKITTFLEGVRVCDPMNIEDLKKCMRCLRSFHNRKLQVDHEFNIFQEIELYESLWEGRPSVYRDYEKTKEQVLALKTYIDAHREENVLTHIDAVPDNFLFYDSGKGEELQLTDWEYAGMQDPHVDIAMFSIYSLYNKEQIDQLISIYFEGKCTDETRVKIYCYISVCGLLWSNWCEYKSALGVEFGEYSLRQYRYAKEYYRIATEEMKRMENK